MPGSLFHVCSFLELFNVIIKNINLPVDKFYSMIFFSFDLLFLQSGSVWDDHLSVPDAFWKIVHYLLFFPVSVLPVLHYVSFSQSCPQYIVSVTWCGALVSELRLDQVIWQKTCKVSFLEVQESVKNLSVPANLISVLPSSVITFIRSGAYWHVCVCLFFFAIRKIIS